jgi:hypothetical protein
MKKLLQKILLWFRPVYKVLYKTADGRVELYTISAPQHRNEFGNQKEGKSVVGFRSYCFNRKNFRSFRYDRIININKV